MFDAAVSSEEQTLLRPFQQTAPVKVIRAAHALGLRVFSEDLGKFSGKLQRDEKSSSGWTIRVNGAEPAFRRRFTIAHEIGHFVLHRHKIGDGVEDDIFYRSSLSNKTEAEANAFAADLLMPWSLIDELTGQGKNTPKLLADALQVSEIAMSVRLGIPT